MESFNSIDNNAEAQRVQGGGEDERGGMEVLEVSDAGLASL